MTREEAKKYIGELKMYANSQGWDEEYQIACDVAMNELEQEPRKGHIDKTAFKEYQKACDENMRRFFSILSIVLKREYNFEESDDKEEISEMLCKLNEYLEEYKGYTTDELTDICFEETEIKLVSK